MTALTVVYLKSTGHILAALTRAEPPAAGEPLITLLGSHLSWHGTGQATVDVAFHAPLLDAATVDDKWPDVSRSGTPLATPLIDPQAFQVVQDPQNKTPPKVTKFATAFGAPAAHLNLVATPAPRLTVTLANVSSSASLPAIVVLQKVTIPSQAGTVLPPTTVTGAVYGTVVANSGFNAGDTWSVFVFVQGMPPAVIDRKVL
jgi:hypothetical protein